MKVVPNIIGDCFPVAHIQGTKMTKKRNVHFKAPLVFLGGTLVKQSQIKS